MSMNQLEKDPDMYAEIAECWERSGTFSRFSIRSNDIVASQNREVEPTAYRPPLYPLLLRLCLEDGKVKVERIAALHFLLSILTAGLVFAGCFYFLLEQSLWKSAAASLLVVIDPILLQQSVSVMTETMAALIAVACIFFFSAAARFNNRLAVMIAAYVGLGMGIYCRPTFLIFAMFVFLGFFISLFTNRGNKEADRRITLLEVLTLPAILILMAIPWILHTHHSMGKPMVTTTHGGYTLWLANNDWIFELNSNAHLRTDPEFEARNRELLATARKTAMRSGGHWETEYNKLCYAEAIQTVSGQPATFAKQTFYRVLRFWSPLPQQTDTNESSNRRMLRFAVGLFYGFIFCGLLRGLWFLRSRLTEPWLFYSLLLVFAFTVMHAFFWSNMRMRAPIMPVLYPIAIAGVFLDVGKKIRVHCNRNNPSQ